MELPEGFEPITSKNAERVAQGDFSELMLSNGEIETRGSIYSLTKHAFLLLSFMAVKF